MARWQLSLFRGQEETDESGDPLFSPRKNEWTQRMLRQDSRFIEMSRSSAAAKLLSFLSLTADHVTVR